MSEIHSEIYTDSDGTELTVMRSERVIRYHNSRGQYHRLDGPAYENLDGVKEWFQNDQLHRLDGPAIEDAGGYKEWWQNGNRHRLDGPACEHPGNYKEWFVDGKEVEPLFLVSYWLERGRCCWYDESTQELRFSDP